MRGKAASSSVLGPPASCGSAVGPPVACRSTVVACDSISSLASLCSRSSTLAGERLGCGSSCGRMVTERWATHARTRGTVHRDCARLLSFSSSSHFSLRPQTWRVEALPTPGLTGYPLRVPWGSSFEVSEWKSLLRSRRARWPRLSGCPELTSPDRIERRAQYLARLPCFYALLGHAACRCSAATMYCCTSRTSRRTRPAASIGRAGTRRRRAAAGGAARRRDHARRGGCARSRGRQVPPGATIRGGPLRRRHPTLPRAPAAAALVVVRLAQPL
jgi:hypothetical protein